MKIVSFGAHAPQLGAVRDGRILAFSDIAPALPTTLEALLAAGPQAMEAAAKALDKAGEGVPLEGARLWAPLRAPQKFLGIGFNYASHVEEVRAKGIPIPDLTNQIWFNKQVSCITGPYDPIHKPVVSDQMDYEGEMVVVIGRRCRHVSKDDARKVIAGYMVCNEAGVRDWQLRSPTATLGKSFDTHGPIGPWLTTADEIEDPENLSIKTWVDDELRQDGNTNELVNRINDQIAYLTTVMTLMPGDLLSTGSPKGVGAACNPARYLKVGQTVRVEIEGLGHVQNEVIAEPLDQTTFID